MPAPSEPLIVPYPHLRGTWDSLKICALVTAAFWTPFLTTASNYNPPRAGPSNTRHSQAASHRLQPGLTHYRRHLPLPHPVPELGLLRARLSPRQCPPPLGWVSPPTTLLPPSLSGALASPGSLQPEHSDGPHRSRFPLAFRSPPPLKRSVRTASRTLAHSRE